MKKLIFALSLHLATQSLQAAAQVSTPVFRFTPEVSALFTSPHFSDRLAEQVAYAATTGEEVQLTIVNVMIIDPRSNRVYVEAHMNIGSSANGWRAHGHIVGILSVQANGSYIVESVYFSPITPPPGGASVRSRG
jgi:hypothetical protein